MVDWSEHIVVVLKDQIPVSRCHGCSYYVIHTHPTITIVHWKRQIIATQCRPHSVLVVRCRSSACSRIHHPFHRIFLRAIWKRLCRGQCPCQSAKPFRVANNCPLSISCPKSNYRQSSVPHRCPHYIGAMFSSYIGFVSLPALMPWYVPTWMHHWSGRTWQLCQV